MQLTIPSFGILAVLLAGGCNQLGAEGSKASLSSEAGPAHGQGEEGDEDVPLDQVPAVVLNAALAAVPGLVVEEAEMEVEDGVLVYALAGSDGDEEVEVDVTAAGQVLKVERGDEDGDGDGDDEDEGEDEGEEIPLDQVPALVLNAAVAAVPGLVVEEAEMEVEDGVTVYDLEGTAAGEEVSVEVTSDGQVLKVEKGDEEGEHENGEEGEEEDD